MQKAYRRKHQSQMINSLPMFLEQRTNHKTKRFSERIMVLRLEYLICMYEMPKYTQMILTTWWKLSNMKFQRITKKSFHIHIIKIRTSKLKLWKKFLRLHMTSINQINVISNSCTERIIGTQRSTMMEDLKQMKKKDHHLKVRYLASRYTSLRQRFWKQWNVTW